MKIRLTGKTLHYLGAIICTLFLGCSVPPKITAPMYPTVTDATKSTLIIDNAFNPALYNKSNLAMTILCPVAPIRSSSDNLRIAVFVDGFRITTQDILEKGITKIDIMEGNHKLIIQASPKPGMNLFLEDTVIIFDSKANQTYKINITGGGKMMDLGYKLSYEGFDKNETDTWPTYNYAREI